MDNLVKQSKRIPVRNQQTYVYRKDTYDDKELLKKLINHGGYIIYQTNKIVPDWILEELAKTKNNHIEYEYKNSYMDKEIRNIQKAFMATKVVINVPVEIPTLSPYEVLFSLHAIKVNADVVKFKFPELSLKDLKGKEDFYEKVSPNKYEVKPEYRFQYFKYVQDSLSIWAMEIQFEFDREEEYERLEELIQQDKNKRYPPRKKGGGK